VTDVRLLDGVISDINTIPEKDKEISSQLLIIFILNFLVTNFMIPANSSLVLESKWTHYLKWKRQGMHNLALVHDTYCSSFE
jgi:hypothetical protein